MRFSTTTKQAGLMKWLPAFLLITLLVVSGKNQAQILWSSSGGSAWLTGSNWTGSAVPGPADVAQFGANPTGTTGVGINFNSTTNAGTQVNGQRIEDAGAIEITSARAAAFLVGNSSSTAGATGTLRLLGVSVNSVANTILRNASSQNFTIQNIQGSGNQTMGLVLGNATDNVVNVDGTGNITISSIISGSGKHLTVNNTSSGNFILSNATGNTFDGGITVNSTTGSGRLRIDAPAALPTTGTVRINTAGVMRFNVAGTYGGVAQALEFNPNQTTTPSLDINFSGTATWQGTVNLMTDTRIEPSGSGNGIIFSGNTSGSGNLIKQAAGTLTLSGTGNNLTGGTQIGNGALTVSSGSSMGTGALTLAQTSTNATTVNLNNAAQTLSSLSSTWTATSGTIAQTLNIASGHVLTINQSTNTTFGTGAVATLTSTIAGSGSILKSGAGTLTLSSANSYTGTTTINGGILQLGASNIISNSSNFVLGGGTFSTGASTGNSETVGTLDLTASTASTIALGTGNHTLTFANSSSLSPWGAGATLNITGWAGTAGASGTGGKIMVGIGGLTSQQLAKISFAGYAGANATILGTGELVPSFPPPVITVNGAGSATATAFTTTYGTASAAQTFTIAGTNLTANITATAPTGFEVANDGATYGISTTFTQSGGNTSGTLSVRLAATAAVAGSYDSQNITLTSTGATTVNITTAASGNIVNPAILTVSGAAAGNKEYDATDVATITGTLNGIIGGDDVSLNGTGTFAQVTVGTGIAVTSASTLTGAESGNYTLTQPTGLSADITAKELTITGIVANNKTFDGNTTATLSGTPTLVGVIPADAVNVTASGTPVANFTQSAVGNNIPVIVTGYTLSGSAAGNYSLTQPTGLTGNITSTPTPVITSTLTHSATYGSVATTYTITATNSPISYNAMGLPLGLNVDNGNGQITGTPTDNPGDYNVTITATNGGGTSTPATLVYTILPKHLDVLNAAALSKEYDRTNTATIIGDLDGIFGSDDVSLNGTGTFAQSTVGTGIAVTSTSVLTGADANKYTFTQLTGLNADINAKGLIVISATASNKPYDDNTLTTITGIVLAGVISPDDVSASGNGNFATSQAGNNIAVTTSLVLSGADAGNYTLEQPDGLTANITPAGLTISGISASNKPYDGNNNASLTGTATLNGVINSDDVSVSGTAVATFNNKTVGAAKPVSVTGYTLAGADAGNYSVSQPTGLTADITTAFLTISNAVAQNKTFDGNTNAVITGTLNGIISPDVVTLVGTGTFNNASVGNNKPVTSTSTLAGADATNYIINPQPTGLTANIIAVPDTLAKWTYEPRLGTDANPTPNIGIGSSSLVGSMTGPGTATGMSGTGCGAQVSGQTAWAIATAAPGSTEESSGAQFNTSTVGHQNIKFSYDQRSSNTSANTERVQYTTNGTTWNNFTMTASNTTFCLGSLNNGRFENNSTGDSYRRVTVDLSSVTGINNNPNFGVRVVAAFYQNTGQFHQTATPGSLATAGTWRFDNVYFAADQIPPGSTAAVLSGDATICNATATNLQVAITGGISPYTVVYSDGTSNFTVNNYTSGANIPVSPSVTTTYTLVSVTDASSTAGTGNSGSATVTVNGPYTITVTAGLNGSITPGTGSVNCGDNATYTITPNGGFAVQDVIVDGSSVGAVSSYTFTNVTANHTINATFVNNTTYTIAASAGANGSISPNGSTIVNNGANQSYTIAPITCYHVADVIVDGSSVGAVTSYTFTNVTANHTISASFAINAALTAPVVTGPVNVCPYIGTGDNIVYTATSAGATGYTWVIPPNVSIVSGQGTATLTVNFLNGFAANGNKQLRVTGLSACGNSPQTLYVLVAYAPGTPQPIVAGSTNVCAIIGTAGTITYTIPKVTAAISYVWTNPAGTTIGHPNGTGVNDTTVTLSFSGGFTSGSITVAAANGCGTSATRSLAIVRNTAATPGLISGPTNVCENILPGGTAAVYKIVKVASATSYNWNVNPATANVTHPNGLGALDTVINVTFQAGFTTGSITVSSTNGCNTSTVRSLSVSKLLPATPGVIDVISTQPCPNREYTYTIASFPANATSLVWNVPAGGTIVTGQNTTSITVSYPGTTVSGQVTVQALSNCGSSVTRSTNVLLPACPPDGRSITVKGNVETTPATMMQVNVFPNPTVSNFKLRVISAAKDKITARITDMQGRLLKTLSVDPNQQVDFGADLKAGIYIVETRQGTEVRVSRIIKF